MSASSALFGGAGGEILEETRYTNTWQHIFALNFRDLATSQTHCFGIIHKFRTVLFVGFGFVRFLYSVLDQD